MPLEPGAKLGPYEVLAALGAGGMGEVYRARDTKLNRDVALKVLPDAFAQDTERMARFQREAQVLASLNHPNIAAIYGLEDADDTRTLVLELVEGPTLADRIAQGPIPVDEALPIAKQIAEALEAAHEQGIIHRDLKPANIKVTAKGQVKLLDFGIAKRGPAAEGAEAPTAVATQVGTIVGTVRYMSPEQLQGQTVDARSDLFSCGVVLYEALTGAHPFTGENEAEWISSILRDQPPSLTEVVRDCPGGWGEVIERCLAKQVERRCPNAAALQEALQAIEDRADTVTRRLAPLVAPVSRGAGSRTPLVGREPELDALRTVLREMVAGSGRLVTIAGEPGVGKTRLSTALLDQARSDGCFALVGHCSEGEGARSFLPWVEVLETTARTAPRPTLQELLGDAGPEIAKLLPALRRLFPDLPPPLKLEPESERHYLFLSLAEFLERLSRVQPLVLVLEDLHWADEPTLQLLQYLAARLGEMPVLLVATYRDVELDVAPPLAAALRQLTKDRLVHRVTLRRLAEEAVGEMLAALSGQAPPASLAEAIHHETEGNPFFVEEVYEHLAEEGRLFGADGRWLPNLTLDELDVPEGVRLVVGRRLERLGDRGQQVLTMAAMLGRRFSYALLETAVDLGADEALDEIEAAERVHLIEVDGSRSSREPHYRFAHELIRQTLLAGLSTPRRQRLHLRVAEAMERHCGDGAHVHAAGIAHHLYEAGASAADAKTSHWLTVAGDEALESRGFEEALRSFDRALSIQAGDAGGHATVLFKRGRAHQGLNDWNGAIEDWSKALALHEASSERLPDALVWRELAHGYIWTDRAAEAVEVCRQGLDKLGGEASEDRCRLLAHSGGAYSLLAKFDAAEAAFADALAIAQALGDAQLEGEVRLRSLYHSLNTLQSQRGREGATRAVECLRSARDPARLAEALVNLHYMSVRCGQLDALVPIEEEARRLLARLGRLDLEIMATLMTQCEWLGTGNLDVYEDFARDFVASTSAMGAFVCMGHTWLAQASIWRGAWQEALEHAQRAVDHEIEGSVHTGQGWSTRFLCDCLLGDKAGALALLDRRLKDLPIATQPNRIGAWCALAHVVEGLAVLGETTRAAQLYPDTVKSIETGTIVPCDANRLAETVAGIAASAAKDWVHAEQHFERALHQAHTLPFRSEQAEVRRWWGRMLLDRDAPGDRDSAGAFLGEAAEMYQNAGMPKHLEMVARMSAAADPTVQ